MNIVREAVVNEDVGANKPQIYVAVPSGASQFVIQLNLFFLGGRGEVLCPRKLALDGADNKYASDYQNVRGTHLEELK